MRLALALVLFGLTAFTMIGDGHIRVTTLSMLLGLGGVAVLLSHFRLKK